MTDPVDPPEQGEVETLVCARYKDDTSRFTGTVKLSTLLTQLNELIPVDSIYVSTESASGEVTLKQVATLEVKLSLPQHSLPAPLSENSTQNRPPSHFTNPDPDSVGDSIGEAEPIFFDNNIEVPPAPEGEELDSMSEDEGRSTSWLKRISGH